ncbi:hypothetical protein ACFVXG_20295 [Kitasatospora sp. NPDC058162]|uniref:hypothetical protein n=1 Tax=Kitasatospora sp. NPDC058162 TaxID=3346362 RepID=UPI0036DDB865
MNHNSPSGIERYPDLLPAVLADGDRATISTTMANDALRDAVQLAQQFRAIGFTASDFDRFAGAFTAPDPAAVFACWADRETRTGIRRTLLATLVTIEEAQ